MRAAGAGRSRLADLDPSRQPPAQNHAARVGSPPHHTRSSMFASGSSTSVERLWSIAMTPKSGAMLCQRMRRCRAGAREVAWYVLAAVPRRGTMTITTACGPAEVSAWFDLAKAVLTQAGAILAGLGGGWLVTRRQDRERKNAWIREKLDRFYGPMNAYRIKIVSLLDLEMDLTRRTVDAQNDERGEVSGGVTASREREMTTELGERADHSADTWTATVDVHRAMVELFLAQLQFAEASTLPFLRDLLQCVELWERERKGGLPRAAMVGLRADGQLRVERLIPFYTELDDQLRRLSRAL